MMSFSSASLTDKLQYLSEVSKIGLSGLLRPNPHSLGGGLIVFSRQDFKDHKDMGGEGKGGQKESVNEWNMEKGRADRSDEK